MNPLQSELHRLYRLPPYARGPEAPVHALVLELIAPPGWRVLGRVWQGVQDALELPAPGIAVSGTDGMQLWFSLAEPVSHTQGLAFLQGLCDRFLADIAPGRLRLTVGAPAPVPALREATGNWSAFVAADLAPVFDDTPWLDIEPNQEGQAALLRALRPATPAAFSAALRMLEPSPQSGTTGSSQPRPAADAADAAEQDPRRFLLRVMNDETVALALRIEAARALLPGA